MPLLFKVLPGDPLKAEIEANARHVRLDPETWLRKAVRIFLKWSELIKEGDGLLVVGKGDELLAFEAYTIEDYRKSSGLRATPGIGPEDLGGYPPGTTIWKVPVDEEVAVRLRSVVGAASIYEAVGFAIWRQCRYANTLREDRPGWEPGIVLRDHIFRSLTKEGAWRRLPGATYEPVVPVELPLAAKVRAWTRRLTGIEPQEVELTRKMADDPFAWSGLLYCNLAGSDRHRHGPRVPPDVLEVLPRMTILFIGPAPTEANALESTLLERRGHPPGSPFPIIMADLLCDPAPLAQMQALLGSTPVKALVVSAGVVACPHGIPQQHPTGCCPGWQV